MSDQERNEILKSIVFGMSNEEICEIYDLTDAELQVIAEQGKDRIEEIKNHYKKMEG